MNSVVPSPCEIQPPLPSGGQKCFEWGYSDHDRTVLFLVPVRSNLNKPKMPVGDDVNKSYKHKPSRIRTDPRLTSCCLQNAEAEELNSGLPRTNPDLSGGREELNQRLPDFESSTLNYSATPPPLNMQLLIVFPFLFVTQTGFNASSYTATYTTYNAKTYTYITYN